MTKVNANLGRSKTELYVPGVLGAVALALAFGLPAESVGAPRVGVAAAVNPDATGQPPSQPVYELVIGGKVVQNEIIRTQAKGRTQMIFLDGSSLTIGPNADMVIDKFVYDPDAKTGQMAISATKGVFRFVGGRISKKSTVQIKTPNAQIGIRGGVAIIEVGETTRSTFLFGKEMTVSAGGKTQRVTRSGFSVVAPAPGLPPLPPEPVTIGILAASLEPLEPAPEDGGGQLPLISDQDVQDSQLALLGSDSEPELLTQTISGGDPGSTQTLLPPPPPPPELIEETTGTTATIAGGGGGGSLSVSGLTGRYKSAPATGPGNGTKDGDANYNRKMSGSIASNRFSGTAAGGNLSVPIGAVGTSLAFAAGDGTSPFGRVSGKSHFAANGEFAYFDLLEVDNGNTRATAFAGRPMPVSALPTSGTTSYLLSADYVLNSNVAFIRGTDGGNIAPTPSGDNGGIIWNNTGTRGNFGFLGGYDQGVGASQKSVTSLMTGRVLLDSNGRPYLTGSMRGSAQLSSSTAPIMMHSPVASVPDANGNHFYGSNGPSHFALQAATVNASTGETTPSSATSVTGATEANYFPNNYALRPTTNQSFIEHPRTSRTLKGFAAGVEWRINSAGGLVSIDEKLTNSSNPSNVTVTTNSSNNTMSAVFNIADPGTSTNRRIFRFGDGGTPGGRSLFVDDQGFAAIESATASTIGASNATNTFAYMFTDKSDGDFLPDGVTFCQNCDALAWGFWGGQLVSASGDRHNYHLGTWVAGMMSTSSDILAETFGSTATYTGHVAGVVTNGSSSSLAVGKFQTTYNFGHGNGTTTITNFDGGDYTGSINHFGTGQENRFSGSLNSTSGPTRNGSLDGAFYVTNGDKSGGVGGQVKFYDSGTYRAATTFAATKN